MLIFGFGCSVYQYLFIPMNFPFVMTLLLDYLTQGPRIFLSSKQNHFFAKKYSGNAQEICAAIVRDCWNGKYFQTSTGNFAQFWTRDFGWCTSSLVQLGYEKEVHLTLKYALNRFRRSGKIMTSITPSGRPFDFPTYAVDSLPWLIHSIKLSKFSYYTYQDLLNKEIERFYHKVINPNTGLVRTDKSFSSIKDFAIRKSSCYDNCMVAMLARDLQSMSLVNPFTKFDYPGLIKRNFWNGEFFYDDLSQKYYVAGDANTFPFVLGIFNDREMLKSVVESIRKEGLDQPFPLKYTHSRSKAKFIWQEVFLRNYEGDTIWTHMGPLYIKAISTVDKAYAMDLKKRYTHWIEYHHNYLEVFTSHGKPYSTPFYLTDRGMLWAVNYLTLQ